MTDPFFRADQGMRVPSGTHVCQIFGSDQTRPGVVADFLAPAVYRPQGAAFSGPAMLDRLRPDIATLVACESAVDDLIGETPLSARCQCDAGRFDADHLFEIVRVHPYRIVDGQIVANPGFRGRSAAARTGAAADPSRRGRAAPAGGGLA